MHYERYTFIYQYEMLWETVRVVFKKQYLGYNIRNLNPCLALKIKICLILEDKQIVKV